jgi:hypothetical protein
MSVRIQLERAYYNTYTLGIYNLRIVSGISWFKTVAAFAFKFLIKGPSLTLFSEFWSKLSQLYYFAGNSTGFRKRSKANISEALMPFKIFSEHFKSMASKLSQMLTAGITAQNSISWRQGYISFAMVAKLYDLLVIFKNYQKVVTGTYKDGMVSIFGRYGSAWPLKILDLSALFTSTMYTLVNVTSNHGGLRVDWNSKGSIFQNYQRFKEDVANASAEGKYYPLVMGTLYALHFLSKVRIVIKNFSEWCKALKRLRKSSADEAENNNFVTPRLVLPSDASFATGTVQTFTGRCYKLSEANSSHSSYSSRLFDCWNFFNLSHKLVYSAEEIFCPNYEVISKKEWQSLMGQGDYQQVDLSTRVGFALDSVAMGPTMQKTLDNLPKQLRVASSV